MSFSITNIQVNTPLPQEGLGYFTSLLRNLLFGQPHINMPADAFLFQMSKNFISPSLQADNIYINKISQNAFYFQEILERCQRIELHLLRWKRSVSPLILPPQIYQVRVLKQRPSYDVHSTPTILISIQRSVVVFLLIGKEVTKENDDQPLLFLPYIFPWPLVNQPTYFTT